MASTQQSPAQEREALKRANDALRPLRDRHRQTSLDLRQQLAVRTGELNELRDTLRVLTAQAERLEQECNALSSAIGQLEAIDPEAAVEADPAAAAATAWRA